MWRHPAVHVILRGGAGVQLFLYTNEYGKPPKCILFVFDGKKVDKQASFQVDTCRYDKKYLIRPHQVSQSSSRILQQVHLIWGWEEIYEHKLGNLDQSKIRGEYKIWIYKRYLAPSFLFALSVDSIPESAIKKMQAIALRKI